MDEEKNDTGPSPEAGGPPEGKSQIHVDTDWKKQAQAEKERLAREVEEGQVAPGPAGAAAGEAAGEMPPADFSTLVQTLATQAAVFLSDQRDPRTGRTFRRPEVAKHHIDLLAVLEEKTKGNLKDEEKELLDTMLYELRLAYVAAVS
jgi:hypothetical protein